MKDFNEKLCDKIKCNIPLDLSNRGLPITTKDQFEAYNHNVKLSFTNFPLI